MAACIHNSKNHCIYQRTEPPRCQITDSFSRFIKRCRTNASDLDSCNPIHHYRFCAEDESKNPCKASPQEDQIWLKIRQEAESDITQEPILSKFYYSTILSHSTLESALSSHLALKLSNANLSTEALYSVFLTAVSEDNEIQRAIREDLKAVKERDPACVSYAHCLLNFKGFLALQAYRIAHNFWVRNRKVLALVIQNRVSEVFAVDIHPRAKIGRGIMFDHATGIVIGETAVVGDNVTILHNVTLGGTGKVEGERHPKIGNGVLIGAGTKVLGNIRVGDNAKIGAGSVVLKEIPAQATTVGNPARLVGLR